MAKEGKLSLGLCRCPSSSSSSSSCSSASTASFASRSCSCGGGAGLFGDGEKRRAALLCAAWRGYSAANFRPGFANFARGGFSAGAESDEEEDRSREWEEQLRSRLKELEEMKELERRAEEVQRRIMSDEGGEEGETEEEKRNRVRKELEKLAKEQAERRETAKLMFDLGQKAYGKGMYSRAVEFLEGALTIIPRPTLLGGEIQIWLAMAYEANNRHKDCIELYQELEKKHPSASIRRQAAELRYILQAPKLKISKDEMVTIPLIGSSYDRYAGTWSDKYKDRDDKRKVITANQLPSSKDYWGDFMGLRPPADWQRDRALWLAVTLLLAMVGFALLQS
ncbi:unnamed protein product [Spirodela intermedia]|uniref:Uncharacterized protein n=1 Tax=Spirodela intermedia TaxID=51605 RepID=A0A7I8JCW3_SPIIN|nr:unnamed protein product [Spirodela intermedia]CAA6667980.1 unnamed protein product [Spirodela intermedia]